MKHDPNATNAVSLVTANGAVSKFAYSEIQVSPKVYVCSSDFKEVSKLIDGAAIEYLAIEFSNSEAILTMSGIPEFQIIIWLINLSFFQIIFKL